MAVTATSIFAQSLVVGIATLTSPTPITSRANITGTTGLTQLTPTSTNGKRVDWVEVKLKETSVAGSLFIWLYNGTTSFLMDEILIAAVTASTTVESDHTLLETEHIFLGATDQLYISTTVDQDMNVIAWGGNY